VGAAGRRSRERQHHSHGRRNLRPVIGFDDMVHAVSWSDRLDIVAILAFGAASVRGISEQTGCQARDVSRQLKYLEEFGIVVWDGHKTSHIYRLTDRIKTIVRGDKVQIGIPSPAGHWVWINVDLGGEGDPVPLPDRFLDGRELAPARQSAKGTARSGSLQAPLKHARQEGSNQQRKKRKKLNTPTSRGGRDRK